MASYGLLDQSEEDALHKSRLLSVEEKPFKRITKRLLSANSLIASPPTHLPTPPPDTNDADDVAASLEAERQQQLESRRQFREDIVLDFAAFESSIARIQFLLTSNARERERYAAEKVKITETAQSVRESTTDLRSHLEAAQQTLAVRKTWDELTEKITNNRMLRPREDQHANLAKLNAEIAELERESRDYAETWAERRQQFGKIVREGMELRKLIRDEKEEVERREGMEENEDAEEGEQGASRSETSVANTPKPEASGHLGDDNSNGPQDRPSGRSPRPGVSGANSPLPDEKHKAVEAGDDVRMSGQDLMAGAEVTEEKPAEPIPSADTMAGSTSDVASSDGHDEGEEDEGEVHQTDNGDTMDVT
ncbi:MAG: hypothetical protein M1817_002126 [Caeruleum heppii]|nr:MAG: hypothetical protein M1817_002126 [Caeruleum heppii]